MSLAAEGPGGKLHCGRLGRPVGARTGACASYGDSCGVGANLVRATLGGWLGLAQAAGFWGQAALRLPWRPWVMGSLGDTLHVGLVGGTYAACSESQGQAAPNHLGRLVETVVGAGSGHREFGRQAAVEPGAVAEVGVVCGKSQGQAAWRRELYVVRVGTGSRDFRGQAAPVLEVWLEKAQAAGTPVGKLWTWYGLGV